MAKAKKVLKILLIVTTAAALVNAVAGAVSLLTSEFTSFPWWSNIVFTAIYFGPVMLLEALALLGICFFEKHKQS